MASKKTPIYIDALSFAQARKSGVGHIAEELTLALEKTLRHRDEPRKVYLVVPLRKAKFVRKYESDILRIKTMPLPGKILHLLNKWNLLPPLDIFLGKGDYIFPNYRNWRLAFSRSFTYIHDLSYLHYEQFVEPKNLAYLKKNIPVWIRRSDKILTASDYTKEEIIHYLHVDADRVSVVPHGVDTETFHSQPASQYQKVLERYGIETDGFILHVGNIEPRKNIRNLLTAYTNLSKTTQEKHPLVLVGGDGWLNDAEKVAIEKAISKGLIIIQPSRYVEDADLPAIYSAASVVAMPSFYEGFGMPPLQAMACGIPVIVADNSSLHELFSGVGTMVGTSPASIQKGLETVLKMSPSEKSHYKKEARRVAEKYSWNVTAEKLLEVVNE
jgi:glycosyltransferase involved in cell wall biosynthesis